MKLSVRLSLFLSKSLCLSDSRSYLSEVSKVVKQQTKQLELMEEVHELENNM